MSSESDSQAALAWNFYQNPRQPYDDFVSNYVLKPLKFTFVQKHYDRPLAEFVRELPELMHRLTTVHGPGGSAWFSETIGQIERAGVPDLYAFLDRVATRSQAQRFLEISGVPQPSLMGWMDYLKQWWFPYPATLRQLVEDGNPLLDAVLAQLKAVKIANSLTLLEAAAEPNGRAELARQLGIAEAILLDLVQRADVSRLPYTSGGAVKRLWVMGYRSLAAIRAADPQEYAARIKAYFAAGGKGSSFDSKMANILTFLKDARHAPDVVKTA
jgi:hypothetical protein